jgi:chromosome segregation ATPase
MNKESMGEKMARVEEKVDNVVGDIQELKVGFKEMLNELKTSNDKFGSLNHNLNEKISENSLKIYDLQNVQMPNIQNRLNNTELMVKTHQDIIQNIKFASGVARWIGFKDIVYIAAIIGSRFI